MKRALAGLAALGLASSLFVHASTYFGGDVVGWPASVWLLHVGMFVVFIPAIILDRRGPSRRGNAFADSFPLAPRWMGTAVGVLFLYAFLNFALFLFLSWDGSPQRRDDGTFHLQNHGRHVRDITEHEFDLARARTLRGFSGHWMLFYAAAMAMLVSSARQDDARRRDEE